MEAELSRTTRELEAAREAIAEGEKTATSLAAKLEESERNKAPLEPAPGELNATATK